MKIERKHGEGSAALPDIPACPRLDAPPATRARQVLSALLLALALTSTRATVAAEEPASPAPAEKPAAAEPATPPPPAVSKPFQLPVFEDGPWKGKFAVYEHANFDFWIDAAGGATVQLKENGKPVGKPFTLATSMRACARGKATPSAYSLLRMTCRRATESS